MVNLHVKTGRIKPYGNSVIHPYSDHYSHYKEDWSISKMKMLQHLSYAHETFLRFILSVSCFPCCKELTFWMTSGGWKWENMSVSVTLLWYDYNVQIKSERRVYESLNCIAEMFPSTTTLASVESCVCFSWLASVVSGRGPGTRRTGQAHWEPTTVHPDDRESPECCHLCGWVWEIKF